jgi:hypothetical protein
MSKISKKGKVPSPTGGKRACLCKDGKTYSKECCTGELHAQGIGALETGNNSSVNQVINTRTINNN